MIMKKQVIVLSVLYDEANAYGGSAAEDIAQTIMDLETLIHWDMQVVKEETMSTEITEEDLKSIHIIKDDTI